MQTRQLPDSIMWKVGCLPVVFEQIGSSLQFPHGQLFQHLGVRKEWASTFRQGLHGAAQDDSRGCFHLRDCGHTLSLQRNCFRRDQRRRALQAGDRRRCCRHWGRFLGLSLLVDAKKVCTHLQSESFGHRSPGESRSPLRKLLRGQASYSSCWCRVICRFDRPNPNSLNHC